MSNEEQDAAIGRTLKQFGEARTKFAALSSEAHRYANRMRRVAHLLLPDPTNYGGGNVSQLVHGKEPSEGIRKEIEEMPSSKQIQDLVLEMLNVAAEKRRLGSILRDAGYEPKD